MITGEAISQQGAENLKLARSRDQNSFSLITFFAKINKDFQFQLASDLVKFG
jgi:hypothetical protein